MLHRLAVVSVALSVAACAQDYDVFATGTGSGSDAGTTSVGGNGSGGNGASGAGTTGQGASTTTTTDAGGGGAGQAGAGQGGSAGGQGGGTVTPEQAVSPLDGARSELPCGIYTAPYACDAAQATSTVVLGGPTDAHYSVTLRVRGVVEKNGYVSGSNQGAVYVGGVPDNNGWNVHRIDVSSPAQHFFLNPGGAGTLHCFAIDYTTTIEMDGGATITLRSDGMDGQQVANVDDSGIPIVVPSIPPAPAAYEGQFYQLNVVSASQL